MCGQDENSCIHDNIPHQIVIASQVPKTLQYYFLKNGEKVTPRTGALLTVLVVHQLLVHQRKPEIKMCSVYSF